MQSDVLDAEQIVAAGDALGDWDVDAGFVCVAGGSESVIDLGTSCLIHFSPQISFSPLLTLSRPCQPVVANTGLVLQDLQPPGAGAVPRRGRLALGHEAEPGRERTGVADGGLGRVGDGGAGRDVDGQRGGAARVELVARHLRRLHVGDGPVALVVGSLPHRLPVAGALAADLDRREGVCGALVHVRNLVCFAWWLGRCMGLSGVKLAVCFGDGGRQGKKSCQHHHDGLGSLGVSLIRSGNMTLFSTPD